MPRNYNLAAIRVFQQSITAGGTAEQLTVKIRAATIAFVNNGINGGGDTITDSGNGFLTAGFKRGDQITISGSASNDATRVIKTVVAGVITLIKENILVAESAGATVKIVAPVSVPDGSYLTLKAKYGNSNAIFVGHSSASAKSTGFTLRLNESIRLQVKTTDMIWIDGTTAEGVEVIFEQNLQQGEA